MKSYKGPHTPGKMNWIQGSRFRTAKGDWKIITVTFGEGGKHSYTIRRMDGYEKTIPAKIFEDSLTFENYLGL